MNLKHYSSEKWALLVSTVLLLVLIGFGQTQPQSYNAKTSSNRQVKFVYTQIGDSVSFQWNSNQNQSIDYCRWDRITIDRQPLSIRSGSSVSGDYQAKEGYFISESGLHHGYCELVIEDVKYMDLTLWECTVIDKEQRGQHVGIALGTVNLTSLVKPSTPYLTKLDTLIDTTGTDGNSTADISCCENDGRPAPKLTITLDGKVLNVTTPDSVHVSNSLINTEEFCLEIQNFRFNWTHNGKNLTCIAEHTSYEQTDLKEDSFVLNIFHEPKILTSLGKDNEIKFYLDKSKSKSRDKKVFVEFVSNPFPQVNWLMKSPSGEYESLPPKIEHLLVQNLKDQSWEATLTNPYELSKSSSFLLTIKNRYGYKEVHVNIKIHSSQTWGWIVIYVVGALALLLLCGFLIRILLKKKGWLCYKGRTGNFKRGALHRSPEEIDETTVPMRTNE